MFFHLHIGRARSISNIVLWLEENSTNPSKDWIDFWTATQSPIYQTLGFEISIKNLDELLHLVLRYLNSTRKDPSKLNWQPIKIRSDKEDWMNLGLCFPVQNNILTPFHFEILEVC